MSYTVLLSGQAEKIYGKLSKDVRFRVRRALVNLKNKPYIGKRLHGDLRGNYSLRIGKFRIIYCVSEKDKTVFIIAIGPRKSIYQKS